ncbi:PREDICTED: class E basic helix-loop-helix protein 40 [Condylura cristata]|uniref:class E basic helix-loop-helix protein 40 n=1 Tax=Condylura cristata TaxID=143302 RepID=UPI000643883E|nr:PREDICTED: class E basic helix-loop-helix protein 40 [Condylura cristata]
MPKRRGQRLATASLPRPLGALRDAAPRAPIRLQSAALPQPPGPLRGAPFPPQTSRPLSRGPWAPLGATPSSGRPLGAPPLCVPPSPHFLQAAIALPHRAPAGSALAGSLRPVPGAAAPGDPEGPRVPRAAGFFPETYKLPHRLIEKKRRDRINECIAQLKDLLPEHLKLTTLGHLEKAVVLELTLKHVKALTSLIDQQQQKILTLQSGLQAGECRSRRGWLGRVPLGPSALGEMPAGLCRKARRSFRAGRGPRWSVAAAVGERPGVPGDSAPQPPLKRQAPISCVVGVLRPAGQRVGAIKQECEEPPAKRSRVPRRQDEGPFPGGDLLCAPFLGPPPHQPPFCLPFYLIPPSAAAYLPMLEKCWYPTSVPVLYPGLSASAAALTSFVNPDKLPGPMPVPQRLPSPAHPGLDSSALLQALKQVPPLNLETRD